MALTGVSQRPIGIGWWVRHRIVGDAVGLASTIGLEVLAGRVLVSTSRQPVWDLGLAGLLAALGAVVGVGWMRARRDWASRSTSSAALNPAGRHVATTLGYAVRSRAEKLIADEFAAAGIRFAYERRRVASDGTSRVPDFTIWDQFGGEWYLEHLGLLKDAEYLARWRVSERWYDRRYAGHLLVTVPGDLEAQVVRITEAFRAD